MDRLSQINSVYGLVAMRQHTPWKCHFSPRSYFRERERLKLISLFLWVCVFSWTERGSNQRINASLGKFMFLQRAKLRTSTQHMALNDVRRWKSVHPGPKPASQCWQLARFRPKPIAHFIHRRTPSSLLRHSRIHTSVLPAQQFRVITDAAAPLPLPGLYHGERWGINLQPIC